ncbi:unnamed protein product [Protopolystoma xenopodis]|uniref:Uncharacterized protein n=1 Tax=Protopolystoma xenopodis TaxID=117903 RepID=A0A448X0F4_9PLAT|nr:unnamed protein product [Protopolystoma xenopodis]
MTKAEFGMPILLAAFTKVTLLRLCRLKLPKGRPISGSLSQNEEVKLADTAIELKVIADLHLL